ncbi:MAG: hypothetical protein AAF513_20470 [Pseudomonadota bacterium]
MRRLRILVVCCVVLALGLNFSWVQAFAVSQVAPSCPASVTSPAATRVAALFGATTSTPIITCPATPRFGLGATIGTTHIAPGLPSIIVLNPEGGASIDVTAHEWAHAEIAQRTSALHRTYRLPTWFDEGLAMQVDHRSAFSRPALVGLLQKHPAPELSEIASPGDFFVFNKEGNGTLHYAYARCVVGDWLTRNPDWVTRLEEIDPQRFGTHAERCQSGPD